MEKLKFLKSIVLKTTLLYSLIFFGSPLTATTKDQSNLLQIDSNTRLCHGQDIYEINISKVHELYVNKKLKPSQLVECYLKRIEALNPYLNAIIETSRSAIKEAEQIKDFDFSKYPLLGIPILIKDNIAVNGMNTTAGANALLSTKPKDEAKLVKKLRKAGAIILAKANLSEFANFRDSTDLAGWSGRGGQTHNAYVLSATASGSSTGSAVGIASNLAVASIGSETNGSIIAPAALAGTFGFKPTVGRVSAYGVIPLAPTQDSIGPITRDISDLILLSSIIFEKDNEQVSNLVKSSKYGYKSEKFTIGVLRKPYFNQIISDQLPILNTTINKLKSNGQFEIVDGLTLDDSKIDREKEGIVVKYEFKHYLNEYLANFVTGEKLSLSKIIEYNKQNSLKELKSYGQAVLIDANKSNTLDDPIYIKSRDESLKAAKDVIDNILTQNKLDVLLAPADFRFGSYSPAAVAGYPIVTIPLDVNKNKVPFGIALYTKGEKDVMLLKVAKLVTQTLNVKRPTPKFIQCCTDIDLRIRN
ncbi:amidase signature enzyme [Neoconidiobolus thromboides FSU 785]|nr:amidase signature enzyme [Neoconidiobolus thromboides FSU 785]